MIFRFFFLIHTMGFSKFPQALLLGISATNPVVQGLASSIPNPPAPEPIAVTELPLPPVAPNSTNGSCSTIVNAHGTGCIQQSGGLIQSGSFLPDGIHVVASVNYTGSTASSIYAGPQAIIIKTDGTKFFNGDAWKCITCGIPSKNTLGVSDSWDYPQTFADGKRLLVGQNIVECEYSLADSRCTPNVTSIYPIRWDKSGKGNDTGGDIRELRLHPDNVHLECNTYTYDGGVMSESTLYGKLQFNQDPKTGLPRVPRYDFVNVYVLGRSDAQPTISVDPAHSNHLVFNRSAIVVAEARGFSGTGKEVTYLGFPVESCNLDVFAASLSTGAVRRITEHPEYCDPMAVSPDDNWNVVMDTRGSGRMMFAAGLRGIPPLIDSLTTGSISSFRNNGDRRFFQPYLLDKYGDRGTYLGQQINAAGNGTHGSINDANWNGMADPKWSPDGTRIVYWQALAKPPACGGENPLPCEKSTEPGGRFERLLLANLTSRPPISPPRVVEAVDDIPWGTKFVPGSSIPTRSAIPPGNYTLKGASHGYASVRVSRKSSKPLTESVAVTYHNYSDDGVNALRGMENVTYIAPSITLTHLDWFSDLVQTGPRNGTKKTSADGFHLTIDLLDPDFQANGTLTTTVNGVVWRQPRNGQ